MIVILIVILGLAAFWAAHFVVNMLLHKGEAALHSALERKQQRDNDSSTEV